VLIKDNVHEGALVNLNRSLQQFPRGQS